MTDQKRKTLIQLIHIGRAHLGMDDDTYRVFLSGVCGKDSAATMSEGELNQVLAGMRKLGFAPGPKGVRPEERGSATLAQLEYIKGMWHRCARNKSERALGVFVKRITGVDALRFLTVKTAQKVILALQDMQHQAEVLHGDS
ncbi:MAG: regulatory protein GemA [Treponema sp.]|jgi:phage gp16-like protein|nr:regulatory protein GemA [Treponema sp.]